MPAVDARPRAAARTQLSGRWAQEPPGHRRSRRMTTRRGDGSKPPTVTQSHVPVLPIAQVKSVLATCTGKSFEDRRDTAIIRSSSTPGPDSVSLLV